MIYLDNNATTRPAPEVIEAIGDALASSWGNPSSVHRFGQEARARVELARRAVGELIGARAKEITFTGSGTEAIDLAVRGSLPGGGPRRVMATTKVEHNAVRDLVQWLSDKEGLELRWLPVDSRGVLDLERADPMIDASVGLVSVQWANNETGVIQPVEAIAKLCWERGVVFHCDATQWIGKMPVGVESSHGPDLDARTPHFAGDILTFSPHKFHGPKGVGVLWCRRGVKITPAVHGTQELGRRGGTENVPGIIGAGAAATLARAWLDRPQERARLAALRDRFEARILELVPDARVNGAPVPGGDAGGRLWNTTNIGFPRLEAEALLLLMSESGLCASAGAACSSGSLDPSPVLLAMGVAPEVAHGSVRFSLSRATTPEEIEAAAETVAACVRRLRGSMTPSA